MNLSIRYEEKAELVVVYLSGEIDAYTAPKLREELIPFAEEGTNVRIDLSGVDYIDSTGLGVFIGVLKATDVHDGRLTLVGMSPRVQRLFTITGLDEVMTIEEGEGSK
ncbi:anti-sigma F factor antagonist [Halalkalibacter wakoensis JCM 9140]|uniref:Anti-sigma factor antagonist n=1 Tax=Halalkalibacter wakoensis JCM 9140 TaxID=1236970 RepID=W4Q327_9BACI|nr:STAS domain-containing protein [Halalkalibacter wakoensis]GAE26451.1 anti-sigma F factor antagonist [Halalkalibacter wakoensis JCM 9140]